MNIDLDSPAQLTMMKRRPPSGYEMSRGRSRVRLPRPLSRLDSRRLRKSGGPRRLFQVCQIGRFRFVSERATSWKAAKVP